MTSPIDDAEDAGAPGRAIDRAERLLGMGVVVVAVVLAVVVECVVMRDGTRVAGRVGVVRAARHRPVEPPPAFWQTIRGALNP